MSCVPASRKPLFAAIAAAACAADLYSKHRVFTELGYPGGRSDWTETYLGGAVQFRLLTSFNHGALWGIGQGLSWLFAGLSVVAAVGVVWWLFVAGAARSLWLTIALALVTGGAFGNLYDRLGLHGCLHDPPSEDVRLAVRDFLFFHLGDYAWPIFNFADVFLVTGAAMLALQSLAPPARTEGGAADREDENAESDPAGQPAGG